MKKAALLLSCLLAVFASQLLANPATDSNFSIAPAAVWQDALVSGNGAMGIMVMGGPQKERIILNHEFLYEFLGTESIPPVNYSDIVTDIKVLHLDGKYKEARDLVIGTMNKRDYPGFLITDPYHPAAALVIEQPSALEPSDYRRTTDYTSGELSVTWKAGGASFSRRSFVSRPDNVIATRIMGDHPMDLTLRLEHQINRNSLKKGGWSQFIERNIAGMYPDRRDELNTPLIEPEVRTISSEWLTFGVKYQIYDRGYEIISHVRPTGGTVSRGDQSIVIEGASEVEILSRVVFLEPFSESKIPATKSELAALPGYKDLFSRHRAVHGEIYNRVRLQLDKTGFTDGSNEILIADQLKADVINPYLLEKAFNMGRYGLLSSSGNNPPNLCGIWTGEWRPIWSGDFTLDSNVNLQISAAAIGNMPEATEAYTRMIERIAPDWEINARHMFNCRGYVSGIRTSGRRDLKNHIGKYGLHAWTGGAVWLLNPCYEYVQCTGDEAFLEDRLLPLMDKVALFYEDFLDTYDRTGKYLISPSFSPENHPANQDRIWAVANATMDIAVIRELLTNMIYEYEKRSRSPERVARWKEILKKLPPYLVNEDGALKEWAREDLQDKYNHRHSSHLYPVWPGFDIDPDSTPDLYQAAIKALELRRPGNGSAHGYALLGLQAARLKQGEAAYEKLLAIMKGDYFYSSFVTSHNAGRKIYNCDALHSLPAIIMEMLVFSKPGIIELLPAATQRLPKGRIDGIVCRTQATVDSLEWDLTAKTLTATITSGKDQTISLKHRAGIKSVVLDGQKLIPQSNTFQVTFEKDQRRQLVIRW